MIEAKRVKKIFHGYPFNAYSFSRLFKNGMRIEIWSDFLALEHTMVLNKFLPRKNTEVLYPGIFKKRFFYLESHIDRMPVHDRIKYKNQLNSLKEIFDYTRPINIVEKEHNYIDYHIFYINGQVNSGVDYYLNHLDILNMMIDKFKEIVNCHIKNKEFLKLNWSLAPKETRKNINQLSNTEMLLLKDIVEGRSYKNNRVGLTANSAKVYVSRMKKKLNIKTRNELIVYYIRNIK